MAGGQNRSTAVMQRRRVAPDALDYFPTPPFATRALCEFLLSQGFPLSDQSCREPACGEMHMVKPLAEYFRNVTGSDVHQYDAHPIIDFPLEHRNLERCDWVITNPPFRLAAEFIDAGLSVARVGVAMLLRGAFLEGQDRYATLFGPNPPSFVLQFVERVAMLEGRLARIGSTDPFAEKPGTKVSTATSYCWFVWIEGQSDTRLRWIAPCRKRLERDGDYPDYSAASAADDALSVPFELHSIGEPA